MGVVETCITRNFRPDEIRLFVRFRVVSEFNFCYHQPLVVTMKLVNLKHMGATFHQVPMFVYHTAPTQFQKVAGFVERYLLFELITRQASVNTSALNRQESLLIPHANAHGCAIGRNITLLNMA